MSCLVSVYSIVPDSAFRRRFPTYKGEFTDRDEVPDKILNEVHRLYYGRGINFRDMPEITDQTEPAIVTRRTDGRYDLHDGGRRWLDRALRPGMEQVLRCTVVTSDPLSLMLQIHAQHTVMPYRVSALARWLARVKPAYDALPNAAKWGGRRTKFQTLELAAQEPHVADAKERTLPGFFKWAAAPLGVCANKARYLYDLGVKATDEMLDALDKKDITQAQALELVKGGESDGAVAEVIEEKDAQRAGRQEAHEEAGEIAAVPDLRVQLDAWLDDFARCFPAFDRALLARFVAQGKALVGEAETIAMRIAA